MGGPRPRSGALAVLALALSVGGFEVIGEHEGNTECWSEDDPKGFDDCCDTRSHGPLGNVLCWEGGKSYNECCYPPFPPAGLPDLCEDGSQTEEQQVLFRAICCQHMDWEGKENNCFDPEAPRIRGFNVSFIYIKCCLPTLHRMLHSTPPAWLVDEVQRVLEGRSSPTKGELDAFEAECARNEALHPGEPEPAPNGDNLLDFPPFCRVLAEADDDKVYSSCDVAALGNSMGHNAPHGYLHAVMQAMSILRYVKSDPVKVDLFVATSDMVLYDYDMPVASFNSYRERPDVLLLPAEFQLTTISHRLFHQIEAEARPWSERRPVAFWRGAISAAFNFWGDGEEDAPPRPPRCRLGWREGTHYHRGWNATNWFLHPRGRLVMLSSYTSVVDAKFTGDNSLTHMPEAEKEAIISDIKRLGLWGERRQLQDFLQYKYLVIPDAVDRAFYLFWTGACIFMPEPAVKMWGIALLNPWEHFIPLRHDLRDLVDKVHWARSHDEEAQLIAERGQALTRHIFSLEHSLAYLHYLLVGLQDDLPQVKV